jgi:parallel beta-helix repeat protein
MNACYSLLSGRNVRLSLFSFAILTLLVGTSLWGGVEVSANHPVLLEGNCDSPVPGTTLVTVAGTCGDYDGDGRIGTAEDTDGADRIFGTLTGALGPGTGAAAGTGANNNGTILIVTSGRFSEAPQVIGVPTGTFVGGNANPGNVTIEAAPGVIANIDAVLQGDPAGGNTERQGRGAFLVNYTPAFADRIVTFRNLRFRNWFEAIGIAGSGNVLIDNCIFENNLAAGIDINGSANVVISRSQFNGNGRRIGGPTSTPSPGDGLTMFTSPNVKISDTSFTMNAGAGIRNNTGSAARLTLYKVTTYMNGTNIVGPSTISPDPNFSQE